jgi:CheY-like chemotaxis protein
MPDGRAQADTALGRPVILIVDDEAALRRVLGLLLAREGFEVVVATGGPDAFEKMEAGLRADIALVDFRMPDMDGAQVLRELRSRGYGGPALLISASLRTEQAVVGMGFDGFIAKPYQFGKLLERLRELIPVPQRGS